MLQVKVTKYWTVGITTFRDYRMFKLPTLLSGDGTLFLTVVLLRNTLVVGLTQTKGAR